LRQDGVEFFLNTKAKRVSQADGSIRLEIEQQGRAKTVSGSHLLVATGRVPNSDALNLSAAGIETDARGFIKVNERLETTTSGVALATSRRPCLHSHFVYYLRIVGPLLEKSQDNCESVIRMLLH
jgi:NADPH-dependent 2,4-dienoyl-CoA reductase/sulfur reductase-like enzyme